MAISENFQISCSRLSKRFVNRGETLTAFEDISFQVRSGEFVCVLGPSGCGKTTLLRTIAGLETHTDGELVVKTSRADGNPDIGMVFQEQALFPWMTVYDNLAFVLGNNPDFLQAEIPSIVNEFLVKVGLEKFARYYPHQLSGGMKQRVSIARGFATRPEILLMDEPFVFLDFQTRLRLHELLLSLWQSFQKTVVFVTHDIEEAVLLAGRVIVMTARPGKIKKTIDINLDRPRDIFAIRHKKLFLGYIQTITELLKEEMQSLEIE
ncbi:MAG: ABC transporter ATP-binding protein [Gammaproteobacteria bacterium]|nr:ABC transporter ATP-binding protein [Gammaproteobacteria bacterium]